MLKYAYKVRDLPILLMPVALLALCLFSQLSFAQPVRLNGNWYAIETSIHTSNRPFLTNPLSNTHLQTSQINRTGGHYLHIAPMHIEQTGEYVLDFKNTSVIAKFRHQIFDAQNRLILKLEGGIESGAFNPFFLRHGRDIKLDKGNYIVATEVISTNYLAPPEPYVDDRRHYQQAIKSGNTLTLIGLGVFLGLGIYYTALAMSRNRWAEAMYAVFILGNFIFNCAALLLLSDVFNVHSLLLVSMPILFSNIAYIVFVMRLLKIKKQVQHRIYWLGVGAIGILSFFLGLALAYPNWALELSRYGVALFLSYGLLSAILESIRKNSTAKRYLLAISMFFVLGIITVSLSKLESQFTFYIEHMGLVSVAIELVLLALVLAYQFSQLHTDREKALEELKVSVETAYSDALTGLPNRHALVKDIIELPVYASLTFIDLDGLKYYNDTFGHARGDDLLSSFASTYKKTLGAEIKLYRLGGDEFAIINPKGDIQNVELALEEALQNMKLNGFEFAGASLGSAYGYEAENIAVLMRMADTRMYDNKRMRKSMREKEIKNNIALIH